MIFWGVNLGHGQWPGEICSRYLTHRALIFAIGNPAYMSVFKLGGKSAASVLDD